MTKNKKAAPAEKVVNPERQPVQVAAPEKKQLLQSKDVRLERDEGQGKPLPPRGMMSSGMKPLDELGMNAKPEELAEFAEVVKKRRAAEVSVWLRCDNPRCAIVGRFKAEHQGTACMVCNWRQLQNLGHLQPATEQVVKDFQVSQKARDEEAAKRIEQAAFAARNTERAKFGLPPFTLEGFRDEQRRAYLKRVADDKEIARITRESKRLRAERMKA